MIREDDKNAVVFKIVEKLQSSSLFLEMKADLQVKRQVKLIYMLKKK